MGIGIHIVHILKLK